MPGLGFEAIPICHWSLLLPLRLVELDQSEVGFSSETKGVEGDELCVKGSV